MAAISTPQLFGIAVGVALNQATTDMVWLRAKRLTLAQSIQRQHRTLQLPLTLSLSQQHAPLLAQHVLRLLPKKRLVVLGEWQSRPVVAKIFWGRGAKQYAQQEQRGVATLIQAKLLTPTLLQSTTTEDHSAFVLIFSALSPSEDLYHLIVSEQNRSKQRKQLNALITLVAQHHTAGLLQKDLHPDNFLFANDQIYTLDAATLKSYKHPLNRKISFDNLALMLAQFPCAFDELTPDLLATYLTQRQWQSTPQLLYDLKHRLHKQRLLRSKRYLKKTTRDCSEFVSRHTFKQRSVFLRDCDTTTMKTVIHSLADHFKKAKLLKKGRSSTVIQCTVEGRRLVIKRYNIKNFGHRLKRCLQKTRALRAWHNAHRLRLLGLPTARPIACIETRFGFFRSTSYFIAEYLPGPSLLEWTQKQNKMLHTTLAPTRALLNTLWQQGLTHGDLKATNILIQQGQPFLIDLDSLRQTKCKRKQRRLIQRDQQRFSKNWATLTVPSQTSDTTFKKELSVIIINYNAGPYLITCLLSLMKYQSLDLEIIVVDNASNDQSLSLLKPFEDKIVLIKNTENLGFSKANNQAFQVSQGRYLYCLNPDAACLTPGWDRTLIKFMDQNPHVGLAGTRLIEASGEILPQYNYPNQRHLKHSESLNKPLAGEIAWVKGASMILHKEIIHALQGFDERFFLYGEEVDLCLRIRNLGYNIAYFPEVTIEHRGSVSEAKTSDYDYYKKKQDALYRFYNKHYHPKDIQKLERRDKRKAYWRLASLHTKDFFLRRLSPKDQRTMQRYRAIIETLSL